MSEKHVLTDRNGEQVTLEVRRTLWLRAYLACLIAVCRVVGRPPDVPKLRRMIERGSEVRVIACADVTPFVNVRDFIEFNRDWVAA